MIPAEIGDLDIDAAGTQDQLWLSAHRPLLRRDHKFVPATCEVGRSRIRCLRLDVVNRFQNTRRRWRPAFRWQNSVASGEFAALAHTQPDFASVKIVGTVPCRIKYGLLHESARPATVPVSLVIPHPEDRQPAASVGAIAQSA